MNHVTTSLLGVLAVRRIPFRGSPHKRHQNLTEEQREEFNARQRERYHELARRRRAREATITFFTLIKHSSSSLILLYAALYYALTILTTPLACWVFNEYKKREALRIVRNLRCGGPHRLILNFRCGLGNNPYHGAVV